MPTTTLTPVGPAHVIGGVIHVQLVEDKSQSDPSHRFSAEINVPGWSKTLAIADGQALNEKIPVNVANFADPTLHVEVDDFRLLPAGTSKANATGIAFLLVFKIVEIFKITIGSIPVTASLK